MPIVSEQLEKVRNFDGLAQLFHDELGWPQPKWNTFQGVAGLYDIPQDRGVDSILAVQQLSADQTWGIFLVDFGSNKLRRSQLRSILNKVAERERQQHAERTWAHENILFICLSESSTWTLGHYTGDKPASARLRTFGWRDPKRARTALENINKLEWRRQLEWRDAWNVERLTTEFFTRLNDVFKVGLASVSSSIADEQDRRLFIQLLLNRLLFIRFLEEKRRLTFHDRHDYLRALWEESRSSITPLYPTRLNALFGALNHPLTDRIHAVSQGLIDSVPYLNGGLFETDERFTDPNVRIPEQFFDDLLGPDGLFYRFNFTAEESSPTDIQVAVDPEILGRIFEQLVIKEERHESGSYYTPREIVQFMCREALVSYLAGAGVTQTNAKQLVTEHSKIGITDDQVDLAFESLKRVTIVDPACGSGAYLLGMLQELYGLFNGMERRFAASTQAEEHARKLWIIEHSVYGVDMNAFATNTAMLRLWLTLMIEDEGTVPQPLPNLDYKIEQGDSLMGPDPQERPDTTRQKNDVQSGLDFDSIWDTAKLFLDAREAYQKTHGTSEKRIKRAELEAIKSDLREKVTGSREKDRKRFDWRVEFPDVMIEHESRPNPGFDIVLANPPYVNSGELLRALGKDAKDALMKAYPQTATGTADLLVYFFERGVQLLRTGGQFVFISSNKWLKAGYGQKLRSFMSRHTAIHHIIDFGDLPLFQNVIAYPLILIATKDEVECTSRFTTVTSLKPPYPDLGSIIEARGGDLSPEALGKDGHWQLEIGLDARKLSKMRERGIPLGEYLGERIYHGIQTSLNEVRIGPDGKQYGKGEPSPPGSLKEGVFIIGGERRSELIAEDPRSAELIRPLVIGKDIRRWTVENNDRWLIVTPVGINITAYPAIKKHFERFSEKLSARREKGDYYWELRRCAYYDKFDLPKIVYQEIADKPVVAILEAGWFINNKAYMIPTDDLYLLGVLNSNAVETWLRNKGNTVMGGAISMHTEMVSRVPIPNPSNVERAAIEKIVEEILRQKSIDRSADVGQLEDDLNRHVDYLYFGDGDSFEQAQASELADIRALLRRPAEDATLEFKETLFFDVRLGAVHGDRVLDVAKAICAMLNRDGGTILIGVADAGNSVVGIQRDLEKLETPDRFQRKLAEPFGVKLRPDPSDLVRVRFIPVDGKLVARVDVKPDRTTMYTLSDKVFVRRDGESREISGVDLALWWSRRQLERA